MKIGGTRHMLLDCDAYHVERTLLFEKEVVAMNGRGITLLDLGLINEKSAISCASYYRFLHDAINIKHMEIVPLGKTSCMLSPSIPTHVDQRRQAIELSAHYSWDGIPSCQ